ncbi:MAG: hypothetical protein PHQ80_02865 [Candidatus ainarchaeum sp.]|nr:hypothetical protein [Candidatus ainarchaeum sp.]MDD5096406.1 hypothetical protein [Candidatus ainarchaeum sp.]
MAKDDEKILSVKFNKGALEKKVAMRGKAVERQAGRAVQSLEEKLSSIDLEALEVDVKKRPLLYLAVAFTAGIAIGAIISGGRRRD